MYNVGYLVGFFKISFPRLLSFNTVLKTFGKYLKSFEILNDLICYTSTKFNISHDAYVYLIDSLSEENRKPSGKNA